MASPPPLPALSDGLHHRRSDYSVRDAWQWLRPPINVLPSTWLKDGVLVREDSGRPCGDHEPALCSTPEKPTKELAVVLGESALSDTDELLCSYGPFEQDTSVKVYHQSDD